MVDDDTGCYDAQLLRQAEVREIPSVENGKLIPLPKAPYARGKQAVAGCLVEAGGRYCSICMVGCLHAGRFAYNVPALATIVCLH